MKLYVLDGGIIECDKSLLTAGRGMGQMVRVPVPMYLVEVEGKKVLIDTGMTPGCAEDPDKTWGPVAKVYKPIMTKENTAIGQLEKIGVKPEDIDYVIQTHLHLDHAGSTQYFKNAEVIVQLSELRYCFWPDPFQKAAYIREDIVVPEINYVPVEGRETLFGDRIELVPTPGHTPGHQSVVIRLPKTGTIILTGDAVYMRENLEENVLPGLGYNPVDTMKSMQKLRNIAENENGQIWYGHDPELWKTLKKAPEYYK